MAVLNGDVVFGVVLYAGLLVLYWFTEPPVRRRRWKTVVKTALGRAKPTGNREER